MRIFAIQMLNSLNFLQKMNIVHCDVKPENFVLKTWGKSGIKLIDFGTSCYQGPFQYIFRPTSVHIHPISLLPSSRDPFPTLLYNIHRYVEFRLLDC